MGANTRKVPLFSGPGEHGEEKGDRELCVKGKETEERQMAVPSL